MIYQIKKEVCHKIQKWIINLIKDNHFPLMIEKQKEKLKIFTLILNQLMNYLIMVENKEKKFLSKLSIIIFI